MTEPEGPTEIIEEIIDLARIRLTADLNASLRPAIEDAMMTILQKYGKLPSNEVEAVIDSDTPRVDLDAKDDHYTIQIPDVPANPSHPNSPRGTQGEELNDKKTIDVYVSSNTEDKGSKKKKGSIKKRIDKSVERRFDKMTDREDQVNPRLEKAAHALFLNVPGIAQVVKAFNTRQVIIANNDERPIPTSDVEDLGRSKSRKHRKEELKRQREETERAIIEAVEEAVIEISGKLEDEQAPLVEDVSQDEDLNKIDE